MAAVNNAGNINPLIPQNVGDVTSNRKPAATDAAGQANGGPADRIEISRQARTVNRAVNTAKELPEVRAELVEKAKQERLVQQIRVPASELAAKMLFEDTLK